MTAPRIILIGSVTLAVVTLLLYRYQHLADRDLNRLLAGTDGIAVEELTVHYQQRRVVCSDRSVLTELSEILSEPESEETFGCVYRFTFRFSTGRSYTIDGHVGEHSFGLAVPSAQPHERTPTHFYLIPESASERLQQIMTFLEAPWEEVGGLSMVVPDGKPVSYTYELALSVGNPPGSRVSELTATRGRIPK